MIRIKLVFAIAICITLLIASMTFGSVNTIELRPTFEQPVALSDMLQSPQLTVDHIINQVMDDAVVLQLDKEPFCSGQLARNNNGEVHVYTAAHCCAVYSNPFNVLIYPPESYNVLTNSGYSILVKDPIAMSNMDVCQLSIGVRSWYDIITFLVKYDVKTNIAKVGKERRLFLVSPFPYYDYAQRVQSILITGYAYDNSKHRTVTGRFYPGQSGSAIVNIDGDLVGHAVAVFPFANHFTSIISILDETPFFD